MSISKSDILFFERAISLANEAERQGNLPVGAVVCYDGKIVAEGKNAIWHPTFNPNRHAEIEALRDVPEHLWEHSRELTLYTTLEPCLMCMGAILLHQIGRVVFGASDNFGGASTVTGHLPPFFENELSRIEWIGPAYPDECDPLYERLIELEKRRGLET